MTVPLVLVLFDIDGTLLDTQEAGVSAYQTAARVVLGTEFRFEGIPLQGKLDHENYAEAVARHCVGTDPDLHEPAFRRAYAKALDAIADERNGFPLCPGVGPLLAGLEPDARFEIGLLTGNWEETGRLKIRRAGIDDSMFRCNAFADDGSHRDELVPVAREGHRSRHGVSPARTVVIGDTPRDIRCAIAGDAVPLGVATGIFDTARLHAEGAELALESLTDTERIIGWLAGDVGH